MVSEGNGTPTLGELGRNIDSLRADVRAIDAKVDRYANLAVDQRLGDVDRRLTSIERVMTTGATQRSSATWQGLFLVLGVLGSLAVGVLMAVLFGAGR